MPWWPYSFIQTLKEWCDEDWANEQQQHNNKLDQSGMPSTQNNDDKLEDKPLINVDNNYTP